MLLVNQNHMDLYIDIVEPPMETVAIRPSKDTHISSYKAAFNYGISKEVIIKNDKSNTCKLLIQFEVPAISPEIMKDLKDAKLILNLSVENSVERKLDLKFLESTAWTETGVTWLNRPEAMHSYKSATVPAGTRTAAIDLTDLLVNNTETTVYSFLVEDASSVENKTPLYIYSKESWYAPYLEYRYCIYPETVDVADCVCAVMVNRNSWADLDANVKIKNGLARADLHGAASVRLHAGSETLAGGALIHVNDVKEVPGASVVPLKGGERKLSAISLVNQKGKADVRALFEIYKAGGEFPASLKIAAKQAERRFDGTVTVSQKTKADLRSIFKVPIKYKECTAKARVTVNQKTSQDLLASALTTVKNKARDMTCNAIVAQRKSISLPARLNVKEKAAAADFAGKAKSVQGYGESLEGVLSIPGKEKNGDIPGAAAVNAYSSMDVNCCAGIKEKEKNNDVLGFVEVRANMDLPASATVSQKLCAEIADCQVISIPLDGLDMLGSCTVGARKAGYAFIM